MKQELKSLEDYVDFLDKEFTSLETDNKSNPNEMKTFAFNLGPHYKEMLRVERTFLFNATRDANGSTRSVRVEAKKKRASKGITLTLSPLGYFC